MGWNAGATGELAFPDRAALLAWRKGTTRFDAWDDWGAIDGFPPGEDLERGVGDLLAFLRGYHHPQGYGVLELREEGERLVVTMDQGEDSFREVQYELAWALRAAADFGAEGRVWLMGTAGAEGDFAYELTLGKGRSALRALTGKALHGFYAGPVYRAFFERVTGLLEKANPSFRAFMKGQRQGQAPAPRGGGLHERVVAALERFDDAALQRATRGFPRTVPTGSGQASAAKAFPGAGGLRRALAEPGSEEVRGLAHWLLGRLDPAAARPLALEALGQPGSQWVAAAAVEALEPTLDDEAVARIAAMLKAPLGLYPIWSAGQVLGGSKLPSAGRALAALLGAKLKGKALIPLGRTQQQAVVAALGRRSDRGAAPRLAAFARDRTRDSSARRAALELLLAWGDRDALKAVLPVAREEYGPSDLGVRAWFAVDPKGVLAEARRLARLKSRGAARDVVLHQALAWLPREAAEARKAKRPPLLEREPGWAEVALSLLRLGDHYLAYNALGPLAELRGDARVGPAVARLLAEPKVQLHQVAEALQRLADPATAKAIERRLAEGDLEGSERAALKAALQAAKRRGRRAG